MSVTATLLTADADQTDRTLYQSGSIAPTGGRLILAFVSSERQDAAPPTPTVSGNGLTWTLVDSVTYNSGLFNRWRGMHVFRASGPSPSAGAVTFDFGATMRFAAWIVAEFEVDLAVGDQGVIQSAAGQAGGAGSQPMTVTLNAFAKPTNATFMVAHQQASGPPTFTPEDGYTEVGHVTSGQDQDMGIFLDSEDTTPTITSSNTTQAWHAVGVELAEDTGGGGPAPTPTSMLLTGVGI